MRQYVSTRNPECPAIKELASAIEAVFPDIVLLTTNNVTPGTRHTSGVAIDIMLDVTKDLPRRTAHGMIDAFVRQHGTMKWSDLIYSDYVGGKISYFHIPAGGGYGGKAGKLKRNTYDQDTRHGDHIHLDYVDWSLKNSGAEYSRIPFKWSAAAKTTGFKGDLMADLAKLKATLGSSTPKASVPAWLLGWWVVDWRGEPYYYLFDPDGVARYTRQRPPNAGARMTTPQDKGAYTTGSGNTATVTWGATGSIERFHLSQAGRMSGLWNDREPLSATRLG